MCITTTSQGLRVKVSDIGGAQRACRWVSQQQPVAVAHWQWPAEPHPCCSCSQWSQSGRDGCGAEVYDDGRGQSGRIGEHVELRCHGPGIRRDERHATVDVVAVDAA